MLYLKLLPAVSLPATRMHCCTLYLPPVSRQKATPPWPNTPRHFPPSPPRRHVRRPCVCESGEKGAGHRFIFVCATSAAFESARLQFDLKFFWLRRVRPGRRLINIYPRWQEALYQVDQRSRLDVNCGDAGVSISSMTCTNSRIQGFILTNGSFARERFPFFKHAKHEIVVTKRLTASCRLFFWVAFFVKIAR